MFKGSQCINNSVTHTDDTDSECTVKALVCREGFSEKILVYIATQSISVNVIMSAVSQ